MATSAERFKPIPPKAPKADPIAAELRRRIESGELAPGTDVPTVDELVAAYGLGSRETAHRVHRLLSNSGHIRTKQGRTAIVANRSPLWVVKGDAYDREQRTYPEGLTPFEVQAIETGERAHTIHHSSPFVPCPDFVAPVLGVSAGSQVVHVSGEGFSAPLGEDGAVLESWERVVGIYDVWLLPLVGEVAPAITRDRVEPWEGGIRTKMDDGLSERWGHEVRVRTTCQDIYGRAMTEEEAARFGVKRPAPVMVEDVTVSAEGQPISFERYLKLFDLVKFHLERPLL